MPHDFRNKSFQKVLRGYAPDEVDDYIAYMNEEYRKLERRTADSERKLALALKKLDESAKNGSADSVGPAAREAAAKLLREAEAKRSEILAMTEQQANESAERIIHGAQAQAEATVNEAVQQAEAILAEAKAEAQVHRDDVKKAQDTARSIYGEIGSFREKLFALYNEHLDALDGVTDAAQEFIDGVDGQVPAELPETEVDASEDVTEEELPDADAEEDVPDDTEAAEEPAEEYDAEPETPDVPEEPDDEGYEEDGWEEESEEAEDDESHPLGDEVASNLAFMDRLFATLQSAEDLPENDLYIDIPEDEDEVDPEEIGDFEDDGEFEHLEDISGDGELTEEDTAGDAEDAEFPSITIDWKNRSALSVPETEEEIPTVEESTDFRSADGFDELDEEYADEEYADYEEDFFEENYDEYSPDEMTDETAEEDVAEDEEFDEGEADVEDVDEYHDMDQIFNEDKSKREMSLTDEFNIIFADSKSNQNVKEISRQPIVTPEAPKNAKKHKKF